MDPIGSTYSGSYSPIFSSEKRDPLINIVKKPTNITPQSSFGSPQTNGSQAAYVELGMDPSSEKQQDFRTYNSDGRIERESAKAVAGPKTDQNPSELPGQKESEDPQIQQIIAQLKATEEKVKAHEAAHKSAGGAATGPISYTYTRGPDGRNYITGGEVPISISSGSTPQETISRMQQVIQAALAPADPSPQDRAVAAQAANMKQQAQQEKAQQDNPQSGVNANDSANTSGGITSSKTANNDLVPAASRNSQDPPLAGNASAKAAANPPARPISLYA